MHIEFFRRGLRLIDGGFAFGNVPLSSLLVEFALTVRALNIGVDDPRFRRGAKAPDVTTVLLDILHLPHIFHGFDEFLVLSLPIAFWQLLLHFFYLDFLLFLLLLADLRLFRQHVPLANGLMLVDSVVGKFAATLLAFHQIDIGVTFLHHWLLLQGLALSAYL